MDRRCRWRLDYCCVRFIQKALHNTRKTKENNVGTRQRKVPLTLLRKEKDPFVEFFVFLLHATKHLFHEFRFTRCSWDSITLSRHSPHIKNKSLVCARISFFGELLPHTTQLAPINISVFPPPLFGNGYEGALRACECHQIQIVNTTNVKNLATKPL